MASAHQQPSPHGGSLSLQKTRQRKYHRRSRGGCASCKKRHVRCDEKKPLCTNCLRSGSECGYADPFVSTVVGPDTTSRSPLPSHVEPADPHSHNLLDMMPKDALVGFPVDMPGSCPAEDERSSRDPGPAGFLRWLWATGDFDSVKLPLLHHKLEAYRYVGQQVKNASTATSDSTIATVASLALMEASLWETNPWSGVPAIVTHLRGIRRIMDLLGKPVQHGDLSLFQRTIRMALSSILYGEIATRHDFDDSYYLPPPISLLFMAIWPITRERWWQDEGKGERSHWVARAGSLGGQGYVAFNGIPTEPKQFATFIKSSRCAFMSCYLYMAMLLQKGATSSFIINWLIEQFLDDAARTEKAFIDGSCSRNVWFWTMVFGLSAVASATASNKLEQMQIVMWRRAFYAKIRLANHAMGLNDWDAARQSLRQVAWVDGFMGEEELREAWEEAASQPQQISKPRGGVGSDTVMVHRVRSS
ncbi:hypothetical protein GQ53DRAFT_766966 [Thozetella sp. PMI_491]|nr:hypothetical protein GQ53DRAFT_766966 [Thozetella sp. PMI_491]